MEEVKTITYGQAIGLVNALNSDSVTSDDGTNMDNKVFILAWKAVLGEPYPEYIQAHNKEQRHIFAQHLHAWADALETQ